MLYHGMGVVEDEVHLVFECPQYQIIRMGFTDIFRRFMIGNVMGTIALTDDVMRNLFTQERQLEVAKFVPSERDAVITFME